MNETPPFHVVLSDTVESRGGSTELTRFGICSSVDTLKCIIHSVSLDQKNAGIRSLLIEKAFTIASTDNVDFLLSNAAVYSGDQHRSWHATIVQPMSTQPSIVIRAQQQEDSSVLLEKPQLVKAVLASVHMYLHHRAQLTL